MGKRTFKISVHSFIMRAMTVILSWSLNSRMVRSLVFRRVDISLRRDCGNLLTTGMKRTKIFRSRICGRFKAEIGRPRKGQMDQSAVLNTKTAPFSVPTASSESSGFQANFVAAEGIFTSASNGFLRVGDHRQNSPLAEAVASRLCWF